MPVFTHGLEEVLFLQHAQHPIQAKTCCISGCWPHGDASFSVFCLVSWLKALAILQKWAGALEELWEKATPELFFFKECLKSKIKPELINEKKAKWTFMEYLYLLGIVLGPRLAKSFWKGPYGTYLGFGRPESQVTSPGFCYCSTSSHRQLLNALV